jgi:protein-S-isoprenylcysteine O-methyltransferase Ste14
VKTLFVALRAVFWGACFVLFWGWLAGGARRYDGSLGIRAAPAWKPAGVLLLVAGGILVLACVGTFVLTGRGTAAPFDPPAVFVVSGPYRFVRNPMYIGAALALAGYGLVEGSAAIALLSLVLLLAAHAVVVLLEEPGLERRFGPSYLDYKRRVRRWVPRFRPPSS